MRLRYVSVSYHFGGPANTLERHYRELRDAMLYPTHSYAYMQPSAPWRPPIDIHETPDALHVKIELAGMSEESIDVTLYENALVVTGQREDDCEHDEGVSYHEAQIRYGPFRADVLLPVSVRHDATDATYENGFLRVRLPKTAPTQVRIGGEEGFEDIRKSETHTRPSKGYSAPIVTPGTEGHARGGATTTLPRGEQ